MQGRKNQTSEESCYYIRMPWNPISLVSTAFYVRSPGAQSEHTSRSWCANSKFDVTVEIVDGKIDSIMIGDNKETPDKGGIAIKQLPYEIIKSQSIEIDAISRATVTSNGIKDVVSR